MKVEYDDRKAEINLKKHNLTLQQASEALQDQYAIEEFDSNHSYGEDRYSVLGRMKNQRIVMIVYTMRGDVYRIITARRALAHERRYYLERLRRNH